MNLKVSKMRTDLILIAVALFVIFIEAQHTSKVNSSNKPITGKSQAHTDKAAKVGSTTKSGASTKSSKNVNESFKDWKKQNGKTYTASSPKTESQAEKTFKENIAKIKKHNSDPKATYKQAANINADLTPEEVRKTRKGYKSPAKSSNNTTKNSKLKAKFHVDMKAKKNSTLKSKMIKSSKKNLKSSMPDSLDYSR